ncbi:MAG: hypothetical protein GHCLOJNM_01366 [bacterium]|nr:hypothetical protein [bacterium]
MRFPGLLKLGLRGRSAECNSAWMLLLMILLPLPLAAEDLPPASVEAQVDRTEITIGDPIHYRLEIEYANGVEVKKPAWNEGLESFQILDFERGEPTKTGERWRVADDYTLSTFTPEDYVIPPIRVPVQLPSGATEVLETQPIEIKVKSILPEDESALELRDIKPPISVFSGILTGRVIGAAFAALAIAGLLYALWRRRHRGETPAPMVPPRPEHEVALARIAALRAALAELDHAPDQGECKVYGIELSAILREYLERRFSILALEATTDEIRELLPTLFLPPPPLARDPERRGCEARILVILEETDLLKFAKRTLPLERLHHLLELAEAVIDATRREEAVGSESTEEREREVA